MANRYIIRYECGDYHSTQMDEQIVPLELSHVRYAVFACESHYVESLAQF